MNMAAALLPEFDREMANTRRVLERVPRERLGWKPHQKSTTMGELATHIAQLPKWAAITIRGTEFDLAPKGGSSMHATPVETVEEALRRFDEHVREARAAIAGASEETLLAEWTLRAGERTVFVMPRAAVLRGMVMNHIIHHRAQLGVYLRLNDVPLPSIYGSSADEENR